MGLMLTAPTLLRRVPLKCKYSAWPRATGGIAKIGHGIFRQQSQARTRQMGAPWISDQDFDTLLQATVKKCGNVFGKRGLIKEIADADNVRGGRLAFRQIGKNG